MQRKQKKINYLRKIMKNYTPLFGVITQMIYLSICFKLLNTVSVSFKEIHEKFT